MHRLGKNGEKGDDGNGEDGITGDKPSWGPQVPPAQTPEAPLPIILTVIGVALAGAALAFGRRRTRSSPRRHQAAGRTV
jgi:hypothetical protein